MEVEGSSETLYISTKLHGVIYQRIATSTPPWKPQTSQRCDPLKSPRLLLASGATHSEILTECPTPWSTDLLEKLTVIQLANNFPVYYRILGFFTKFTTAYDSPLPWAK